MVEVCVVKVVEVPSALKVSKRSEIAVAGMDAMAVMASGESLRKPPVELSDRPLHGLDTSST